jgi:formyltetrahydrofolate hydrolase
MKMEHVAPDAVPTEEAEEHLSRLVHHYQRIGKQVEIAREGHRVILVLTHCKHRISYAMIRRNGGDYTFEVAAVAAA